MTKIINVTAATFDTAVAERDGLVLVDLWSPGCMPCRAIAPIVDDLAADFAGDLAVCKVDVDAEPLLSERLAARGVPTLALYRDGKEVGRVLGVHTRSHLVRWIEGHL